MNIESALKAFQRGEFVLIHDSSNRENETDMVIAAEAVKPKHVARMRREAGGLICVALHPKVADNFGLPYLTEIYETAAARYGVLSTARPDDLPYDERSAFSISVNHRQTFTGVTDIDRALTIRELGRLGTRALNGPLIEEFGRNFRSPGHVPLLRAANNLLAERQGHTELAIALADMAGLTPVVAICEMLDADTGKALSWEKAVEYAKERKLPYLRGAEVAQAYAKRWDR